MMEIIRGDDHTINLEITKTVNGVTSAYDLTGAKVWFTIRKNYNDPDDTNYLIQKSTTTHDNASGGLTHLDLSHIDTNVAIGQYYYDVQIKTAEGKIFTVIKGNMKIVYDVTKSRS